MSEKKRKGRFFLLEKDKQLIFILIVVEILIL